MLLTVSVSTQQTVTQVAQRRLVEVAIFSDEVVDVTSTTTQNTNFTNINIC